MALITMPAAVAAVSMRTLVAGTRGHRDGPRDAAGETADGGVDLAGAHQVPGEDGAADGMLMDRDEVTGNHPAGGGNEVAQRPGGRHVGHEVVVLIVAFA